MADASHEANHNDQSSAVWLMHQKGYAAAHVLGAHDEQSQRVNIKLNGTTETLQVDADDIEKSNPPSLDRVEDMSQLMYLNESSVLHLLRQRNGCNLSYTNAGTQSTVMLNSHMPHTLYHHKFLRVFKGGQRQNMPPHVYSVAEQLYRQTQVTGAAQALVFTGKTGTGKTTQCQHVLNYLCLSAGSTMKHITVEKIDAVYTVLKAFGCCATPSNQQASRFATLFTMHFDHLSQCSAASVQALLFECTRVVRRPVNQGNFNVLHQLSASDNTQIQQSLKLAQCDHRQVLLGPDYEKDSTGYNSANAVLFDKLLAALPVIGLSEHEQTVVMNTLGAVMHLACAHSDTGVPAGRSQFVRAVNAQVAAELLGVSYDELHKAIFQTHGNTASNEESKAATNGNTTPNGHGASNRRIPMKAAAFTFRMSLDAKSSITDRLGDGLDALHAFIVGLYNQLFNLMITYVNRALASNYRTVSSITLVDCPGWQQTTQNTNNSVNVLRNVTSPGQQSSQRRSGTLSDLCFNYANERLHELYHHQVFATPLNLYKQEQVQVDLEAPANSPQELVELIDRPSKQDLVQSANIQVRSQERRGLLWLLDEESIFPGATDQSFLERMFVHYGAVTGDKSWCDGLDSLKERDMKYKSQSEQLVRKSQHYNHFIVRHALGTQPVTYDVKGWVRQAQESPVTRAVLPLLQDSNNEHMSTAYLQLRAGMIAGFAQGSTTESTRRATAVLKALNNPQMLKRKTYCAMSKVQMDCLIETVRRIGRVHFVHCLQPYSTATVPRQSQTMPSAEQSLAELHVPTLRAQIRGLQLVHGVRFNKIGFPERLRFSEFTRRFGCLSSEEGTNVVGGAVIVTGGGIKDYRHAAGQLMHELGVDAGRYRLGVTQIFLRADLLCELEEKRVVCLSGVVIGMQTLCRAYLARRRLAKRQMQERAMACIHKNIDKYVRVNGWQWWRLYVKVLPLLSLNRTDDQLHNQAAELNELRVKCTACERQVAEWRLQCDKLQAKLGDATNELGEERAAATHATDALATENADKVRLSQQLLELQSKSAQVERKAQKLELESMQYKNIRSAVLDQANEEDTEDNVDVHERVLQLKQHIQALNQQNQVLTTDSNNALKLASKHADTKVAESEQQREQLSDQMQTQKRRAQKATEELQDVSMHLDKLQARNNELEKKQKRFDSELNAAKTETNHSRQLKEQVTREHEQTLSKLMLVQQQLNTAESSADEHKGKSEQLHRDMRELSVTAAEGGTLHTELVSLRRNKQELQAKTTDQEQELDDLAGQVQQQEATVVRLHMQIETHRQSLAKESEAREQELEELRTQSQRRVRALEQQLEDDQEHKIQLQRQVRELDVRLQEANQRDTVRDDSFEAQLKRDLRRTKALLKDAQSVLEKQRAAAPNRGLLKQLRNQLEDADAGRPSETPCTH